jgi:hypothetical protein
MTIIGTARISTTDQDLSIQQAALNALVKVGFLRQFNLKADAASNVVQQFQANRRRWQSTGRRINRARACGSHS